MSITTTKLPPVDRELLTDIAATMSGKDEEHGEWTEEVGFIIAQELATVIAGGQIDHFYIKKDGADRKYSIIELE